MEKSSKKYNLTLVYFILFIVLILGGIITKRVFNHPEYMMLWHLPAAVFLILSGMRATKNNRARYYSKKRQADTKLT